MLSDGMSQNSPRLRSGAVCCWDTITEMPPDYTAQLKQIVQALNHPTTPAWIIAALSATLGLISGIFAQVILVRINDAYQRDRMRRVLYTDLGGYFMFMYSTLTSQHYKGETKLAWQQAQFEARIKFSVEDYVKARPDIYMQLSEHRAFGEVYLWLHHTVNKTNNGCSNPDMFCQIFSKYVDAGLLKEKYFVRYSATDAPKLMAKVKEARAVLENLERGVASGAIKTVDGFEADRRA